MKLWATITAILFAAAFCFAQSGKPQKTADPGSDYTGMYSFLRDGEFVQLNVESGNRLTGFISRHRESGKSPVVDHFFEKAELHDRELRFSTRKVDGVWFDFKGAISRGPGKTRDAEDYYEIKGTLTQYSSEANQEGAPKALEVTFRSFPSEICD